MGLGISVKNRSRAAVYAFKVIRLLDKSSRSVINAFVVLESEYGERFSYILKTITTDNGSEFSRLSELEWESETRVYYAQPYSSYEKGSNFYPVWITSSICSCNSGKFCVRCNLVREL